MIPSESVQLFKCCWFHPFWICKHLRPLQELHSTTIGRFTQFLNSTSGSFRAVYLLTFNHSYTALNIDIVIFLSKSFLQRFNENFKVTPIIESWLILAKKDICSITKHQISSLFYCVIVNLITNSQFKVLTHMKSFK